MNPIAVYRVMLERTKVQQWDYPEFLEAPKPASPVLHGLFDHYAPQMAELVAKAAQATQREVVSIRPKYGTSGRVVINSIFLALLTEALIRSGRWYREYWDPVIYYMLKTTAPAETSV